MQRNQNAQGENTDKINSSCNKIKIDQITLFLFIHLLHEKKSHGLIAHPKGGLFRYHVKRIHFTMQGFGFLSAILWWGKIESEVLLLRKCRHYLILRDLIWLKIVVGKTIQKQIVWLF